MGPPSRVALVVQRYGPEVNGGAEQLARRVARLLAGDLDLTVLTTCALDYRTWADHYPAGEQDVEGVRVRPLPGGARARRRRLRRPLRARLRGARRRGARAALDGRPGARRARPGRAPARRGRPLRRGGLRHLPLPHDRRRASAWCADRALLVPTLHDEPPARLAIFRRGLRRRARPDLLRPRRSASWRASASAWATTAPASRAGASTRRRPSDPGAHGAPSASTRPYALCVGRIDLSKGVGDLVEHHARYRRAVPDGARPGARRAAATRPFPPTPGCTGWGSSRSRSSTTRSPGRPSWCCRRPTRASRWCSSRRGPTGGPTLANAASPVLVGQSRRSGGGLWYRDGDEYAAMLDLLARARPAGRRDRPPGAPLDRRDLPLGPRARGLARRPGARRPPDGRRPRHLRLRPAAVRRWPGSPWRACSTTAGAGSAWRRSRSASASGSPCSTRWAPSCAAPGRRPSPSPSWSRRSRSPSALRLRAADPGGRLASLVAALRPDLDRGRGARRRRRRRALLLVPDDEAGLRDDHRRRPTTTAGATRPWSTGSRTTRFPRDVAPEPRRAAHVRARGRPIGSTSAFGFEHFAAMLATLPRPPGLRGRQRRRRRRPRRRGRRAGRRWRRALRPRLRPGVAPAGRRGRREPRAGDPVRRELHDPVREHLPLAASRSRPSCCFARRARLAAPASSPPRQRRP